MCMWVFLKINTWGVPTTSGVANVWGSFLGSPYLWKVPYNCSPPRPITNMSLCITSLGSCSTKHENSILRGLGRLQKNSPTAASPGDDRH